jgi:hypothetical protein
LRHSALRERLKYQASPVSMVHVGDGEHLAGRCVRGHAGDETVGVELRRQQPAFLDRGGRAAGRERTGIVGHRMPIEKCF